MKKRLFAMLLALVMCLALGPTAALAAEPEFEIDENNTLTKYNGPGGNVTIPAGVTKIGDNVFWSCESLTGVTIPEGVTSIGQNAFGYCKGLTSVTIPNGVTTIGQRAFSDCTNLTNISIPNSVTSIGEGTFTYCTALTSVIIPNNLREIESASFFGCSGLTSVTIPNSVTKIGQNAFAYCSNLTSVTVPNCVTVIESGAFFGCSSLSSVTLPDRMAELGSAAFSDSQLTSVTIPDGVSNIWSDTFWNCESLTSITIPASVTMIWDRAFFVCPGLRDVYYGGTEAQWKAVTIVDNENDDLLSATIHYNSTAPDQPALPATAPAQPTNDKLSVDGKDATPAAYKIDNANYFKLRDVAMLVNGTKAQFSIEYDVEKKAIMITTGQPYHPLGGELGTVPSADATAMTSNDAVYINGVKTDLTAYKIDNANYYGIRALAKALGFNVDWAPERGMFIETDKPYSGA